MNHLRDWIVAATVRAVKTMAQTAVGIIGAAALMGDVDWRVVLSGSILAAIVSYLTSIAGIPEVDDGASLARIEEIQRTTITHDEEGHDA